MRALLALAPALAAEALPLWARGALVALGLAAPWVSRERAAQLGVVAALAAGLLSVGWELALPALLLLGLARQLTLPASRWAAPLSLALVALGAGDRFGPLEALAALLWGLGALAPAASPRRALWAVVLLAVPLFFLLPRPSQGEGRAQGFAREVALTAPLRAVPGDAALVTVRGERLPSPLYLRGAVLGDFDGLRWLPPPAAQAREEYDITEVLDLGLALDLTRAEGLGEVVFTVGVVQGVAGPSALAEDPLGGWYSPGRGGLLSYRLVALPPFAPGEPSGPQRALSLDAMQALTALPEALDPRIPALARTLAGDASAPEEVVAALEEGLRAGWRWTDQGSRTTLDGFLLEGREGHCEHFATALAVLLRARGLPARVVSGLAWGDEVDGARVFGPRHAHAWVEVYLPGEGWVLADASPKGAPPPQASGVAAALAGGWRWWVAGLDRRGQRALWAAAPWPLLAALLTLVGAGVGWRAAGGLPRRRRALAPTDPVSRAHRRARASLRRKGWWFPEELPPVEAARWLAGQLGEEAAPLERLAWLMYRVRYGGEDPGALAEEARRLEVAVGRLSGP
ncbi:MAG: lasso peptide biosynthesis protein [Deltaproteobacteria bacterium]|nr:lasso peptide biosynthesis protein [Deltaproteobacteria bacterium]